MEKEFVSYKQAVALKELGFSDECLAHYDYYGRLPFPLVMYGDCECCDNSGEPAPLKQQVFRWFRDKYNLHIDIYPFEIFESDAVVGYKYFYSTYHIIECYANRDEERLGHTTYEEAENACIDKLIELTKTK